MSRPPTCPECGTRLRSGTGDGGPCPRCLLELGLEEAGEATGPETEGVGMEVGLPDDPDAIGPYRILRVLGEGGMGTVYLAEQRRPIRRRVAVKVIKLGMDTREVVARFESERQMLAIMSHPGIARVFEAGATEHGRPYFVMEHVEGDRITDYCDRERLTVRQRVELFVQVCGAVQHAHQKGVIHRDLKPSNVLVEVRDGQPTPKVIDFGVAKATGPGVPDRTLLTRRGVWIGTPAYMSPEAAESADPAVDSRTDIYALGVLLYELLSGALPFDRDRLLRASNDEVRRILREEEPPPPSRRLADASADAVAARRGTEPAALRKRLRGDLDWIVLRAMAKERDRRYASVSELAEDLRRHLRHEPVSAGPPGTVYRVGKLVRRHRLAVAATCAVFLTLLLGIVGTTTGLLRAREAEQTARQEARTARAVSDFLVDLFEVSDPGEARGNTVTAREILDDGVRSVREELQEEPRVRARLLGTMGTVYRKLGLYDEAAALLEDALRTQESRPDAEPAAVAGILQELGTLAVERGRFDRAEELLERALESHRRAPEVDEAARARTLKELGVLHYRKGDLEHAETLYRESLEIARRVLGPEHPLVAWNLNDLGNIARDREDYDRAEDLFRRSLAIHEAAFGPEHPYVANNLNNLANAYQYQGLYERALPLRRRAQRLYETILGPEHRLFAIGLTNQAVLHHRLGQYDRAEELYRRGLDVRERRLGPGHPDVAVSLYQLADLYRDQGLSERAEPLYERALRLGEESMGEGHHRLAAILVHFAHHRRATGDPQGAEALLRQALGILEATLPPRHSRIAAARASLGDVLAHQGHHEEAEELHRQALSVRRERHARHPDDRMARADLAASLLGLGRLHRLRGDRDAAHRTWSEAAELLEPLVAASDAVDFLRLDALALLRLGRADEARPLVDRLRALGRHDPEILRLAERHGLVIPGEAAPSGSRHSAR